MDFKTAGIEADFINKLVQPIIMYAYLTWWLKHECCVCVCVSLLYMHRCAHMPIWLAYFYDILIVNQHICKVTFDIEKNLLLT